MANLGISFNANDVEPTEDRGLLPKGDYVAWIVDSEVKETKNGRGQYLKLEFDILEGEYKGRKLWVNLNLINDNQTAVEIAKRDLSSICRAVGVMEEIQTSDPLHTIPMIISVAVDVDSRDRELYKSNPNDPMIRFQNAIKKYKPMQGEMGGYQKPAAKAAFVPGDGPGSTAAGPRAAAGAGGASGGAAPAGGGKKPWER